MRTVPTPQAAAALADPALVMPADDLSPGPARDVRRAMARFRDGAAHAEARAAVERLLAAVDPATVGSIAGRRTRSLVADGRADRVPILVPAAAMAEAIGVLGADDDGEAMVASLTILGDTIVAGTGDTTAADAAALDLAEPLGPSGDQVARLSILHHARGATGALIALMLSDGDARPSAVAATKRTAARALDLAGFGSIAEGETVAVALDRTTEFGHGPHACPGEAFARAIADAAVAALTEAGSG